MTKTNNPLLSFSAKGSLGKSLTFQKTKAGVYVRRSPTPSDPQTLPQMYARWRYQDCLQLWSELSTAEKALYRPAASRNHRTPMAQFLSDYLGLMPDIAGLWHLDERQGSIAYDSSPNLNHGTVFGALPIEATVDYGRCFDGIDDYIKIPNAPSLYVSPDMTLMCRITRSLDNYRYWVSKRDAFSLGQHTVGRMVWIDSTVALKYSDLNALPKGQTTHAAVVISGTSLTFYANAIPVGVRVCAPLAPSAFNLLLANWWGGGKVKGTLDDVVIYNRALTQAQIAAHVPRHFPLTS